MAGAPIDARLGRARSGKLAKVAVKIWATGAIVSIYEVNTSSIVKTRVRLTLIHILRTILAPPSRFALAEEVYGEDGGTRNHIGNHTRIIVTRFNDGLTESAGESNRALACVVEEAILASGSI